MKKTFSENLKKIFGFYKAPGEDFFEELSDALIEGDIGTKTAAEIEETLRTECKKRKIENNKDVPEVLREILSSYVKTCSFVPPKNHTSLYLVLGVNGVGKTTTIAKMGKYYKDVLGIPVILAAADTFRAAAVEQLEYHGEKIGVRVVAHKTGGDPAAVVFDAAEAAKAQNGGLVLVDTAGRLHNKDNLVRELQKIDRIASSKVMPENYKKIIVLDSTTGQNGLRQAEVFHEAVGLDAAVLTKYDSTAKGGVAVSIGKELGLPLLFIGSGEKYGDLSAFDTEVYVKNFIGLEK